MVKINMQHIMDGCDGGAVFPPADGLPHITLYIRDDHFPITYIKAKLTLEAMERGQILELLIKGAEPLRNEPRTVRSERHKIISLRKNGDYYRLLVRKS